MRKIGYEKTAWVNSWPMVVSALMFLLVLLLGLSGLSGKDRRKPGWKEAALRMMEEGKGRPWYRKKERWLRQNGAIFHFGGWMNPLSFLLLKMVLGLLGLVVCLNLSLFYGVLAGIALFSLPTILVYVMNHSDNEKMISELKHIYHALEIQTRAGVYVTDALAEIYGSVQEKRLKSALLDLAGEIVMRADLTQALEDLQSKFDNRYVDSLCIIILQALESGQSVDLLSDLSEQIKDMESALMTRKKEALDRSVTFYQLGILVAILGIVIYACVTQMFAVATGF